MDSKRDFPRFRFSQHSLVGTGPKFPSSGVGRANSNRFCPRLEALEDRLTPSVAPVLHTDTNQKSVGSQPVMVGQTDEQLFFIANDGVHGRELYSSKGSISETSLLKDTNPGQADTIFYQTKIVNDKLFYIIKDQNGNQNLWKSDGTFHGTQEVVSLFPESEKWSVSEIIAFHDRIYFYAVNYTQEKFSLWVSDGTSAGTRVLKDIDAKSGYIDFGFKNSIFLTDNYFYFVSGDNRTLWRSDGSSAGTVPIHTFRDIRSGYFNDPISVGNGLVFTAEEENHGWELWGIKDASSQIQLLHESLPGMESAGPRALGALNGIVYFGIQIEGSPGTLWQTNGTPQGTSQVSWPDLILPDVWKIHPGVTLKGSLYFPVQISQSEMGIWKLDGTKEGTFVLPSPIAYKIDHLSIVNDHLYFFSRNSELDLWKSDGTPQGTERFLKGGDLHLDISTPVSFHGSLYFPWDDRVRGAELWKSDGTLLGSQPWTGLRNQPNQPNEGGAPRDFVNLNDSLLFWATDARTAWNLYSTSEKGSVRLGSFDYAASVTPLTRFGNKLGFVVTDAGGTALWSTDGSPAGTKRIAQLGNTRGSEPGWILPFQGGLLFIADDGSHGSEIWKSDGTEAGTILLKDIAPGLETGIPPDSNAMELNGVVYFPAMDSVHGEELWRTDGTPQGTFLIKDSFPGSDRSFIHSLVKAGPYLFFAAAQVRQDYKLWRTDGTASGTALVSGKREGEDYTNPQQFGVVGNSLFFYAQTNHSHDYELWMIEDLTGPARFLSKIGNPLTGFIPFNDNFIFVGSDKRYYQTGIDAYKIFITDRYNHRTIVLRELDNTDDIGIFDYVVVKNKFYFWNGGLWQTNGKSNGTSLIKSIKSDLNLKGATLFAIGDKVYFRTFDSQGDPSGLFTQKSGVDTLWVSEGTFSSTKPIARFYGISKPPLAGKTVDQEMASLGGSLYFTANDGVHGTELWRLPGDPKNVGLSSTFFGTEGAFNSSNPGEIIPDDPPPTNPGGGTAKPPELAEKFINGLYLTLLNRPADPHGMESWVQQMHKGMSQETVARAIYFSPERRGILVDAYFQRFLGRAPDSAGRQAFVQGFINGLTELDIIQTIIATPEYQSRLGQADTLVGQLYQDLLGRDASFKELRHWNHLLTSQLNLDQVVDRILHSREFLTKEVDQLYRNFLYRGLDSQAGAAIEAIAAGKMRLDEILAAIIGSKEFQKVLG